jgi:hypothetical protein
MLKEAAAMSAFNGEQTGVRRSKKRLCQGSGPAQGASWYAYLQRASDIHIRRAVRFRIDGVLHNVYQCPAHRLRREDGGAYPRPRGAARHAAERTELLLPLRY